ncbi:stigma-specific STIG1-like protein 1 [Ricinus communis]|uniref:Stigma-specific Stig1 family protein n=1 Tax=Ricinus communis TaxID=3988 RepID=B9RXH0_RICCO|nr:stigma-specific STIG1-like protein 1 [Ricinus communis]EEF43826.1 conserved hypothetical protein [Ricinus communis]|eukprot:XP_002518439.3 stigma-specific STIG1-like protein 1 [Ricinus communis]
MAMESSRILFTLLVLVTTGINILSATTTNEKLQAKNENNDTNGELPLPRSDQEASYPLRHSRFLASNPRPAAMTCDRYPSVCGAKGSAGPYCCRKQCVNVMTDESNCGKCGKKCKYSETCCQGKCVNVSNDEKNCGKCNNRCKKGSSCAYGLCSYA